MSFKPGNSEHNRLLSKIKWQLTVLSGTLTTGLIVMLES